MPDLEGEKGGSSKIVAVVAPAAALDVCLPDVLLMPEEVHPKSVIPDGGFARRGGGDA